MNNNQPVTREYFVKRLVDLCLRSGLSGFPKDPTDQHILMKSAVLSFGRPGVLSEKEVNEKLAYWIQNLSQLKKIDPVTLRRSLIDHGYLTRTKDGSAYEVAPPAQHAGLFEEAVEQVNVQEAIANAREEIARRKREYLEKSKGN